MDAVAKFKVLKDRFDRTDLEDATAADRASIVGHDQEKIAKAKRARSAAVQLMNSVSELDPDDG